MTEDRRNPYLVLGVPFGSTREQATVAFARRAKRAKADSNFAYSVEDLTWALNELEAAETKDRQADVNTYRVPADNAAFEPPSGRGVLTPEVVPLARRTPQTMPSEIEELRALAVREELVDALLDGLSKVNVAYGPYTTVKAPTLTLAADSGKRRKK